jgi:EmrB/QacA subfamily drug resistance transporter
MSSILKPPCDEALLLLGRSVVPCSKRSATWILAATILGSSMAFIDGTVVNVALPALQSSFNATVGDLQWVVESYALLLASLLLVGGSLGDRFGRRLIYMVGVAIFALASAWCGITTSIGELVVARGLQGVGGALLVPGSLAIISASFDEQKRGQAIGTWSGFTSITAAVGPVIGGWLIEHYSWRAAFFINVPIAVVVLLLVLRHVPETRDRVAPQQIDWPGAVLAAAGLGCIVYGLIESSSARSHGGAAWSMLAGAGLLVMFLLVESRAGYAMLPLSIFRSRSFSGANLLTFLLYAALSGSLFFLPLNLIQVQGYSATAAGAALLPFILLMFLLSRWSGGLVRRYGARVPLVIGPLVAGVGLTLLAWLGVTPNYWTSFFPSVVVLGFGMAISVAPLTTVVMNSASQDQAGIASGINNAVSRSAGVIAVAALGVVMLNVFTGHLASDLGSTEAPPPVQAAIFEQRTKLGGIELDQSLDSETKGWLRAAIDSAFISGFRVVMLASAALAFASAVVAIATWAGPAPKNAQVSKTPPRRVFS